MTDLEQKIVNCLENKRFRSLTSHMVANRLGLHGTKRKQIIGMAIGRMKKKGIEANCEALK